MQQRAADPSPAIGVITLIVMGLNAAMYVAAFREHAVVWGAVGLTLIILACYLLWTPVSYELAGRDLVVSFRLWRARYGPVLRCSPVASPVGWGVRLFGNGGLFAGSGIFWNRHYGIFRAYVTATRPADMVLVETGRTKVLISPADPGAWLAGCAG